MSAAFVEPDVEDLGNGDAANRGRAPQPTLLEQTCERRDHARGRELFVARASHKEAADVVKERPDGHVDQRLSRRAECDREQTAVHAVQLVE